MTSAALMFVIGLSCAQTLDEVKVRIRRVMTATGIDAQAGREVCRRSFAIAAKGEVLKS